MNKARIPIFTILVLLSTLGSIFGQAPEITLQPQDVGIFGGETATFSISATGSDTLHYQWKKDGVDISGATDTFYTTPAALLADNGTIFTCMVTNDSGSVESNGAYLYVTQADERVSGGIQVLYDFHEGSGETIHDVAGVGTAEDVNIYTPENVAWTPNGLETFYEARTSTPSKGSKITENCNNSDEITVEVWFMPEFVSGQNGRRIFTYSLSGNFRNFSIIQNGKHYEARLRTLETDGNGLPSISTSSSYTATTDLTHLVYTRNRDGLASIYINGTLDTTTMIPGELHFSDNAFVAIGSEPYGGLEWRGVYYLASVYDRALSSEEVSHNYDIGVSVDDSPAFTIHPEDQFTLEGQSASFYAYAVSTEEITYQWKKNGSNISGATEEHLTLTNVEATDDGAEIQCIATTASGIAASHTATLHVTSSGGRVSSGLQLYYTFQEKSGTVINDLSDVTPALNLNIFSTDAVNWEDDGLNIISTPSIITTTAASKIISSCKSSNAITVEAWVKSANNTQTGPANIFSLSADGSNRNFTLAQDGDSYNFALRTSSTDDNGQPSLSSAAGSVSTSGYDHIVFTRASNGTSKIYINGTERISSTISGDFSNWNDSYLLTLANEFGVDRHWLGVVNLIAVYNRELNQPEVLRNFNFGPYGVIITPTNLQLVSNQLGKVELSWEDNSTNEDKFIVERGEGTPLVFTVLDSLDADVTSYIDSNVVDNKDYSYRVKGINSLAESHYSDTISVHTLTTPIPAPTNLKHTINDAGYPVLTWEDNSTTEDNYVIERRISSIGATFDAIDTVEANTTTYTDNTVSDSTTYVYRIYAFNADTLSDYSEDLFVEVLTGIEIENKIPKEFSLAQNFPNPFNPTTQINFGLPEKSNVTLKIFNLLGQEVLTLLSKEFSAGNHTVYFNANNFTSGIYIYTIVANGIQGKNFKDSKKMILIK